jgi:putative sterol carrier protein
MRGGAGYRLAVDRGTAVVAAAGPQADCTITADPVAFLLLGYGRIPQWAAVIRGQLRPGGRKPWLALRFGSLLSSP